MVHVHCTILYTAPYSDCWLFCLCIYFHDISSEAESVTKHLHRFLPLLSIYYSFVLLLRRYEEGRRVGAARRLTFHITSPRPGPWCCWMSARGAAEFLRSPPRNIAGNLPSSSSSRANIAKVCGTELPINKHFKQQVIIINQVLLVEQLQTLCEWGK